VDVNHTLAMIIKPSNSGGSRFSRYVLVSGFLMGLWPDFLWRPKFI